MVLARTDPDMESGHRGLTLFMVEKPVAAGREFAFQMGDGNLSGRAIPTLGYRGMHSFALAFENVFVPDSHVIGEESQDRTRLLSANARLFRQSFADGGTPRFRCDDSGFSGSAGVCAGAGGFRPKVDHLSARPA